jgi:hypothetical protein
VQLLFHPRFVAIWSLWSTATDHTINFIKILGQQFTKVDTDNLQPVAVALQLGSKPFGTG